MRINRIITALSATGAIAALTLTGIGGPASAAPVASPRAAGCVVRPTVPAKITIRSPFRTVQTAFTLNGCSSLKSPVSHISWNAYGQSGQQDYLYFDRTNGKWNFSNGLIDMYDFDWKPGSYTLRPDTAYTADYDEVPQAGGFFRVKYSAVAGLTATRRGSSVTLTTSAYRYDPDTGNHRRGVGGGHVLLQRKSGTTWKTLRNVTLNRQSRGSYTLKNSTQQTYRAVLQEGSYYWTYATGGRVK